MKIRWKYDFNMLSIIKNYIEYKKHLDAYDKCFIAVALNDKTKLKWMLLEKSRCWHVQCKSREMFLTVNEHCRTKHLQKNGFSFVMDFREYFGNGCVCVCITFKTFYFKNNMKFWKKLKMAWKFCFNFVGGIVLVLVSNSFSFFYCYCSEKNVRYRCRYAERIRK